MMTKPNNKAKRHRHIAWTLDDAFRYKPEDIAAEKLYDSGICSADLLAFQKSKRWRGLYSEPVLDCTYRALRDIELTKVQQ